MELNDILKIGEVCEVSGRMIKAGIYANKNTEYLNFNGAVVKNISIGSYVLIRKGFSNFLTIIPIQYKFEFFKHIQPRRIENTIFFFAKSKAVYLVL